jgi:hypothetical protein
VAAPRLERRLDPLVGERRRQADVADRQVRLVAGDDPQQPIAVLGGGDDLDPVLGQERHQALAKQRVVLDDHDPDRCRGRLAVGH